MMTVHFCYIDKYLGGGGSYTDDQFSRNERTRLIVKYFMDKNRDCVLRMQEYGRASCLSNLIDVFIPCEIFSNINPEIGMIVSFL